jgi:hypothetical protein
MGYKFSKQMDTLYIMIIGTELRNGYHLPELQDIQQAKTRLASVDIDLRIILIQTSMNDEPMPLDEEKVDRFAVNGYPEWVVTPKLPLRKCDYRIKEGNTDRDIRRTSFPVIFMDYTGTQTSYDLMEILETATIANRWYLSLESESLKIAEDNRPKIVKIDRLVSEWLHPETFDLDSKMLYPVYNIYSGERLKGDFRGGFEGREFKEIVARLIIISRVIENYLRSGFDKKQVLQVPEPWTMNLHTHALAGLLRTYQLYPKANDKDINYEMATNPQYRQIITKSLIHVLGAFAINNDLISESDIAEYGGWYNVRIWPKIRIQLYKMLKTIF